MVWTVPSAVIRTMDDAQDYAQFWNDFMIIANNFAGFENGQRHRAERFVFDIQIGGG